MAERALGPNKETFLTEAYLNLRTATAARDQDAVLPSTAALAAGSVSLPKPGNSDWLHGRGAEQTLKHILGDIVPGLNRQALSSRYYGFVTGGVLPVAEAADNVVTALDQSLQFYLPGHSLSVAVEDAALAMLLSLLRLGRGEDWPGKTFTTGATASNICGLACGRDAVIAKRLPPHSCDTVPKVGLLAACAAAGVRRVQILTSMAHASLFKAASLVGLGHAAVRELPQSEHEPWRLDIVAVERELRLPDTASIIAVSAGEVNTGLFATGYGDGTALNDMASLRSLADRYDAWIHVDGAFGIFARALPQLPEFSKLHQYAAGLELADSIAADGHKLLNVPYDCGVFFCRHGTILHQLCAAPHAAYLPADNQDFPNPLNRGLENSRRFRALPVYAVLLSEGKDGMAKMFARMVQLARKIAEFVRESAAYEWLPDPGAQIEDTLMIVPFRAKDPELNKVLVDRINESGKIFVSGTTWKGEKAVRIAVSNWQADVERDLPVIKEVLLGIAAGAEKPKPQSPDQ